MGRAKHEAYRKAGGEVKPRDLAPGETLESVSSGMPERAISEEIVDARDAGMRPKGPTMQRPTPIKTEPCPNEIRKCTVGGITKPLEPGYVHPEERNNPEYRREQERRNLAAARPSWGLDPRVKIVNPSPNMGQSKVNVLW